MSASDRWLLAATCLVIAAVWPANATVGLTVLLLATFCLRYSRDLARAGR